MALTESWVFFGLLAAIGFGGLYTIDRSFVGNTKKNIHPFSYATFATGTSVIFMTILMFLLIGIPQITPSIIKYSLIIGALGAFASVCYYYALRNAEASYVAPMTKLSVLFSVLFAFLFLDEVVTTIVVIGASLIFLGSYLIIEKQNDGNGKLIYLPKPSFALLLVVLTALFWSLRGIFDKTAVATISPIVIAVFSTYFRWGTELFLGMTLQRKATIDFFKTLKTNRRWASHLIFRGACSMIALSSFYLSMQLGLLSRVMPLANADAFFVVIFGALFLGEKETMKRLIGSIIVIAGAVLLAI